MGGPGLRVSLDELSEVDVESILTWRYAGEYALYDLRDANRASMLEPANRFLAIRQAGELVGHVCLGVEARVAGMAEDPAVAGFTVTGQLENEAGAWILLTRQPTR